MKYLLLLLVSFSAVAEDQIVQKLKEENVLLMKQMEKNYQFIQARKTLKSNFKVSTDNRVTKKLKRTRKEIKGVSNIYFGLESYDWGDDISNDAPTLSYEMGGKNWSTLFSYGRLSLDNFPANGIQTLVNVFKMNLQYNIKAFSERMTFSPYMSYRIYNVNSPDAGSIDSVNESQRELDLVQRIEDQTGLTPGMSVSYSMTRKWDFNFRADLGASGRVAGLHLGYKL